MKSSVKSTTGAARPRLAPPPTKFKIPLVAVIPVVAVDTAAAPVVAMLITEVTIFTVTAVPTKMFTELLAMSRAGPNECVSSMIA